MKNIYYACGGKEYIFSLTDREFQEAMKFWNNDKMYFCPRLQEVLPSRFVFAKNCPTILLEITEKYTQFFWEINGQLFLNNGAYPKKFASEQEEKEFRAKLISEDDYYDNKKYLKSA